MTRQTRESPGLMSIARGLRWLFYVVLFLAFEALGLFLLVAAPASEGHVERVGGIIIMVVGIAPLLLGPIDELDPLTSGTSPEMRERRSRMRRVWSIVGYILGAFRQRQPPPLGPTSSTPIDGGAGEQGREPDQR